MNLTDLKDTYRVSVEVPGMERENIDLGMSDDSRIVNTTGNLIYHSQVKFVQPVNPDTAKATYKNGNITIEAKKREKPSDKVGKNTNAE